MSENLFTVLKANFPADPSTGFIGSRSGRITSYADMLARTAQYANALSELGLAPGDRVAVQVEKSLEAHDEKRLLRLQKQLAKYRVLIIDELGYVPLSPTGAELLFEVFSQRYERGSTIVTSNLPFDEWTSIFGSERLTGALLDRLTHHVHILEMNGESFRLKHSRKNRKDQT